MQLGKVVKSNSHCDYVVQLDGARDVNDPPQSHDYGFGSFVKLEDLDGRHWAVGLIYNSLLDNPLFSNKGPRLSSDPDPLFTPDLISETRTLLGIVLIGTLETEGRQRYGKHGIPRIVVPINTPICVMDRDDIYDFHLNLAGQPQFCYYSHLLRCGGSFASQLTQQVLSDLIQSQLFSGAEQRALEMLCKELAWKNTVAAMR